MIQAHMELGQSFAIQLMQFRGLYGSFLVHSLFLRQIHCAIVLAVKRFHIAIWSPTSTVYFQSIKRWLAISSPFFTTWVFLLSAYRFIIVYYKGTQDTWVSSIKYLVRCTLDNVPLSALSDNANCRTTDVAHAKFLVVRVASWKI